MHTERIVLEYGLQPLPKNRQSRFCFQTYAIVVFYTWYTKTVSHSTQNSESLGNMHLRPSEAYVEVH